MVIFSIPNILYPHHRILFQCPSQVESLNIFVFSRSSVFNIYLYFAVLLVPCLFQRTDVIFLIGKMMTSEEKFKKKTKFS